MPTVKIGILSYSDSIESFINRVGSDLHFMGMSNVISHQGYKLEFIPIMGSEDFGKLKEAHLALCLVPAQPDHGLANSITASDFRHAIPSTTQAHLVFMGDGQTPAEKTFQSKLASVFPNTTILANKNIGQEIFKLAQSVAPTNKSPSADAGDLASVPLSSDDKGQPPRFISRLLGAVLRAVFGAIVSVVVYNPVSSVFAALGRLRRDFNLKDNEGLLETASAFGLLLLSPVWGPLKGLIIDGILEQALWGWEQGVKSSLSPFNYIPIFANLTRRDTPISKRNIIAGIIITSLVIAVGLAVWLPAVNAVLGISAYAAMYGLGSLSLAQLALTASGAALVAGTILYGLGIGVVKLGKVIRNVISKQLQNDKPSTVSKFFGAIVGAVYGALAGMVIYNPLTSLFFGIRQLWRVIQNINNKTPVLAMALRAFFALIAFVSLPLYETFIVGLWGQGKRGSQVGFMTILVGFEKENSAGEVVYWDFRPQKRDVIAGLVITGLAVAAGLAFIIAPVSIFLGIPALLTTYGLAGMAPWSLALIASGATLGATSILYGVSSNLYDVYDGWRHAKASNATKSSTTAADHSQTSSTAEATRRMRSHAGTSSLEVEPIEATRQNSGGFFSGFTTCLANICGGSSKKSALDSDDDQPLLVTDEAPENRF